MVEPQYFRKQAELCRKYAGAVRREALRQKLLALADDFDRQAESAERWHAERAPTVEER